MTRINKNQRRALYSFVKPLWDTGYETTGAEAEPDFIEAEEFLMRKYRLAFCMKILQKYGITEKFHKDIKIPAAENIIFRYAEEGENEESYWDEPWELISMTGYVANEYLELALKETSWDIYRFFDIQDYEELLGNEKVFNRIRKFIERHWGMMKATNQEYENKFLADSETLAKMGLSPDPDEAEVFYFNPSQNIVLANEKIAKMLNICRTEEKYRQCEEYDELILLTDITLFERRIGDFSIVGTSEENWCCYMYLQGEYITEEKYELIGGHQLTYESVIFLLLADMAAEDFLERYEEEKGSTV